jgi:hypothetical protein
MWIASTWVSSRRTYLVGRLLGFTRFGQGRRVPRSITSPCAATAGRATVFSEVAAVHAYALLRSHYAKLRRMEAGER